MYDQHYWGHRSQQLGIGAAHAPGPPTAESLASALERALHADVATHARSVAATVRRYGAPVAAERVVSVALAT